jgi:hypothetical protein
VVHGQVANSISPRDFTDQNVPLIITVTLHDIDDEVRAAFPDEITIGRPEAAWTDLRIQHVEGDVLVGLHIHSLKEGWALRGVIKCPKKAATPDHFLATLLVC